MLSYFCCSVHALFVLFFYVILDSKRSNNTSPEDGKELEPLNPTSPKGREERNPDDKEGLKRSVNESLFYSVTAVHTHTNIPSGFHHCIAVLRRVTWAWQFIWVPFVIVYF